MKTGIKRAGLITMTAALLAVSPLVAQPAGRTRSAAPPAAAVTQPRFNSGQVEAFASASDLAFIRPGLKIIVNSVTIGSDRKVVVDFNLTDSLDQPIDRLGKTTPGPVSVSFVLSWYDPTTRQYTSYNTRIQTGSATSPHPGATASQAAALAGTTVDLETGHAKFTSTTVLPAGFDQTKTHTLGIYSTRNLTAVVGIDPALQKSYFANAVVDFRPDGGTVTDKWDKMRESTTCNTCHDPL
ncbi:MAG TPA: hypothetical protein VF713_16300, partial [Thermoanaerobaculia bacterium]